MLYKGFYDTDTVSKLLGIPSIGKVWIDTSEDEAWDCHNDTARALKSNSTAMYWNNLSDKERLERLENHGMTGKNHSKETREKMSKSAMKPKPQLQKGGYIVSPTGEIVKFSCLSHFCKENNLSSGHVSELLNGKRNTVKGWKRVQKL